jgi:hypothetical protein
MKKLLTVAMFLGACSKSEPSNRAVDAVRFISPDVVCQAENSTPAVDSAWCRTPTKEVFYCKQGPDVMLECKPYGSKPKAEAPPATPSGSPILPEAPK